MTRSALTQRFEQGQTLLKILPFPPPSQREGGGLGNEEGKRKERRKKRRRSEKKRKGRIGKGKRKRRGLGKEKRRKKVRNKKGGLRKVLSLPSPYFFEKRKIENRKKLKISFLKKGKIKNASFSKIL